MEDDPADAEKHAELRAELDQIIRHQEPGHGAAEQFLTAFRQRVAPSAEIVSRIDALAVGLRDYSPPETPTDATPSVFITSTIRDLALYREETHKAAVRACYLPILSKNLPASTRARPTSAARGWKGRRSSGACWSPLRLGPARGGGRRGEKHHVD